MCQSWFGDSVTRWLGCGIKPLWRGSGRFTPASRVAIKPAAGWGTAPSAMPGTRSPKSGWLRRAKRGRVPAEPAARRSRSARSPEPRRSAWPSASVSSTGFSVAAWSPAPPCWSAATRGSASRRSSSRGSPRSPEAHGSLRVGGGVAQQIKMRADRLGIVAPRLLVLAETSLEAIVEQIRQLRPAAAAIDSIQTVYCGDLASGAQHGQVREGAPAWWHSPRRKAAPCSSSAT